MKKQKQPFPVGGEECKKFEDWGVTDLGLGVLLLGGGGGGGGYIVGVTGSRNFEVKTKIA